MEIESFTFNGFAENTYVLFDETKECIIIDPGCNTSEEQHMLTDFIAENELNPLRLINTHCHIDHVLGNRFVSEKYKLDLESHAGEKVVLAACPQVSMMYGIPYNPSPEISKFLEEGDFIEFGNQKLKILFTPGHSPASISLYSEDAGIVMAGDVLFQGSIGRTDLPGGDFDTLKASIEDKLYTLPDETTVFCGHGPSTTIGFEKVNNPFVKAKS